MFKFYKTNKFGLTVRVPADIKVMPEQIVTIDDVPVKLIKRLIQYADGNASWSFEKLDGNGQAPADETSFNRGLAPLLERIAKSLEDIANSLAVKIEEGASIYDGTVTNEDPALTSSGLIRAYLDD